MPIPQELTEACREPVLAEEAGWMAAHARNAAAYAECRVQYEALVQAVRGREKD